MGVHKSGRTVTALIWLLAFGVLAINIYLVVSRIGGGQPWWVYTLVSIAGVVYLAFSYSLVQDDIAAGYHNLKQLVFGRGGAAGAGGQGGEGGGAVPTAPDSPDARQQLAKSLIANEREGVVVVKSG